METIELAVEPSLLAEVDRVTQSLAMSRVAFMQFALEFALKHQRTLAREKKHAEGYARLPVQPDEFDMDESQRDWGE